MRELARGRVLLIDDNDATRRALARCLGGVYDVVEAPSCEQALDLLEDSRRPFDLVLIDPAFPPGQMTGEAALGHIGSRYPDLALIVMGSRREPHVIEQLVQAGAADYVVKGADEVAILCIRVRNHLEQGALRRENRELRVQVKQLRAQVDGAQVPPGSAIQPLAEVLRRHLKHALAARPTQKEAARALQVDYYKLRRMLAELGLAAPKRRAAR